MTMRRAKGIEFPRILILGAGKGELSDHRVRRLGLDLGDDVLERERALIYVAATRARDALAATWTCELIELLLRCSGVIRRVRRCLVGLGGLS